MARPGPLSSLSIWFVAYYVVGQDKGGERLRFSFWYMCLRRVLKSFYDLNYLLITIAI